jgi:uncharacterized SAM-dependent methyltransferase
MSSLAHVAIHPSQFPGNVRGDLIESLRSRQINHKFHYDSLKQTQKWLALHQAYSPSRTDADCAATYDHSFAAVVSQIASESVHLIGLGCGGGQKDSRLLTLLRAAGKELAYTPSDVSTAMVLVARQTALSVIPEENCFPLVCDLATADGLSAIFDQTTNQGQDALSRLTHLSRRSQTKADHASRLFTFFGMIPNFEPQIILPKLAAFLRPDDVLLLSANLSPGPDYSAGLQRILPLYDNALTRDWLMTFLLDLGVEASDGDLHFRIEETPPGSGLKRVAAYFEFRRWRQVEVDAHQFGFRSGESVQLFFSYRHTPALVCALLADHGLRVLDQWIAKSEEEGVFLIGRG